MEICFNYNKIYDFKLKFNKLLKPVQHFATHFPSNIEDFGPLRFLQSMRYTEVHMNVFFI